MRATLPQPIEIFERAWHDFSEHLGVMVGSMFIMGGIFMALYVVVIVAIVGAMFALRGDQLLFQVVQNAVSGIFGLAVLWGYVGFMRFNLEIARGAEPQLATLFKGARILPNYFLTNSVVQLVMILFMLPIAAVVALPVWALWDTSGTFQANLPAIGAGLAMFVVLIVAMIPISSASTVSIFFSIDRELDPLASIMAGLRAVRPHVLWTYKFAILSIMIGLAAFVLAMTGIGMLVVIPFTTLAGVHYFLAFAEVLEAELQESEATVAPAEEGGDKAEEGEAAQVEGEALPEGQAEAASSEGDNAVTPRVGGALASPEGQAVGEPVSEPPSPEDPSEPREAGEKADLDPYRPPAVEVSNAPSGSAAPGRPQAAPLPAGTKRHRGEPGSSSITAIAITCLVPWVLCGGNPFSGIVVGFFLARRFGFPDYLGVTAGIGVLLLCGVAALVVLLVGHRGRRDVIQDDDGFALDGNSAWTGLRLAWAEIRGFRITGRGVELFPKGRWGWIWRPVVPSRERDTHDLVETLESHGVMRV